MDVLGILWSFITAILGWGWWFVSFLFTTFPFSLIMTIVTIGVAFTAYSEFAKAGGGIGGALVAVRYTALNFPRIAYETMRWTLRMALIDLPRIVGKDLSGSLPAFLLQWLGSSKSEVRIVERVVNVGVPRLTFRQRLGRRARHFLVDAIIVSIAWNWSIVYPWIAPLWK